MGTKNHTSRHSPDQDRKYLKYYGVVFELVILNAVLIWGGNKLDITLGSSPVFILIGTFVAMAGTIWLLLKRLK